MKRPCRVFPKGKAAKPLVGSIRSAMTSSADVNVINFWHEQYRKAVRVVAVIKLER